MNFSKQHSPTRPKVSVCVPVYNVANYIEVCVESLMEQTLDSVEYVFVDDCSPDNSLELLEATVGRYPARKNSITILRNAENMGPGLSRKRAAEAATGEYIYFPDSDDWIETDMLETMYSKAVETDSDIVRCHILLHHGTCDKRMPGRIDYTVDEWRRHLIICDDVYPGLTTSLFRKSIVDNVLTKFPTSRLYAFEDYLLSVMAYFYAHDVTFIDRDFYHCNVGNPNSVTKIISQRTIDSKLTVAAALHDFCIERADFDEYSTLVYNFMAISKLELLAHRNMWQPDRWRSTWPELNAPEYIHLTGVKTRFYRAIARAVNHQYDFFGYILLCIMLLLDKLRIIIPR